MDRLDLAARLPGLAAACHGLTRSLLAGGGGRLGESAVVSVCVHLIDGRRPDEVTALANRDAGQVFYGRTKLREVVHVDVFHEVADVDHRAVARALREAELAWRAAEARAAGTRASGAHPAGPRAAEPRDLLDFIDIQTGTGGGRASGSLRYGRGLALRLAHRNHVHLAALLPPDCWTAVPYLVAAVEEAIAAQGVEVRAVARVRFRAAADGSAGHDELAPYADANDSLIRESGPRGGPGRWSEGELLRAAVAMARELGTVEALRDLLAAIGRGARIQELVRRTAWAGDPAPSGAAGSGTPGPGEQGRTRPPDRALLERWLREGWLEREGDAYALAPGGRRLREYLAEHAGEVSLALRVTARHLGVARRQGRRAWQSAGRGPRRRVQPAFASPPGARAAAAGADSPARPQVPLVVGVPEPWSELAVAETVAAAAAHARGPIAIGLGDIRVLRRERTRPLDLVLLIDASASMAGARIRAAQELALRLLLYGRDRVAIISFQDREAVLRVPLTRNTASLERGVRLIRPFGLTPLAAALETAHAYLRVAHARRPLVFLVTDGIPTVSRTPSGPLEDALRAAEALGRARVPFTCVGLEPNRGYLADLARRARGTLYVVEELQSAALMEIAEGERRRHRPRARVM